jgi:hypothetical protein
MTDSSILDQLRLQEGRLFQNEKVLALYLDVKAILVDSLSFALRNDDLSKIQNANDEYVTSLVQKLGLLAPQGLHEYHSKSLHESVKIVCKLLWPSQMLVTAKPNTETLLRGMLRRLAIHDSIVSKQFLSLDPIKQDFVLREAFRRTLINECLVIFDASEFENGPVVADVIVETSKEVNLDTMDDIGPDDSASQIELPLVESLGSKVLERPSGARSRLGKIIEDADTVLSEKAKPDSIEAKDEPIKESSAKEDETKSVLPRIFTSRPNDSDARSKVSVASQGTVNSVMRKPINVRRIHLEEEKPV